MPDRHKTMDWMRCYREGTVPWDKGEPAPPLVDWATEGRVRFAGRVLVPGCGRGHDAAYVARTFAATEVTGLDLVPRAVEEAAALHAGQGTAGRLRFEVGDVFENPPAGPAPGSFDAVVEHTCYCAIDPGRRSEYAARLAGLLRPGGQLFAIFYLDPYDDEHRPGGGPPHGVGIEELDRLFGGAFELVASEVPPRTFEGREGRELVRLLRRLPA